MQEADTFVRKQPGLFEQGEPDIVLAPTMRQQVAILIEALLLEIAEALASQEASNDQDHS
jgi:hypothetical protein